MLTWIFPQAEQVAAVTAIQLPFVTSTVHLFMTPISWTPQLTLAQLTAIEANFSGYVATTLAALPVPFVDQVQGGVSWIVPTQNFAVNGSPAEGNDIFGGWFESNTNGVLLAWQTQVPWSMQNALQALPVEVLVNFFGQGKVTVQYAGIPQ